MNIQQEKLKVAAMIPARFEASRFPGKLLKDLCGVSVISRTYQAVLATHLFDEVFVVTDSDEIENEIKNNGGQVLRSLKTHECGSDRIAEAVRHVNCDIVINVQGDEPFTTFDDLAPLVAVFESDVTKNIDLASVMLPMTDQVEINNPNNVKVIVDTEDYAMYFSRSPLPFRRDKSVELTTYKHKGIYAFRKQAIEDFAKLPMAPLEAAEKIEAIRFLEYGKKIKMIRSNSPAIGIDTPEDLEAARKYYKLNCK